MFFLVLVSPLPEDLKPFFLPLLASLPAFQRVQGIFFQYLKGLLSCLSFSDVHVKPSSDFLGCETWNGTSFN